MNLTGRSERHALCKGAKMNSVINVIMEKQTDVKGKKYSPAGKKGLRRIPC